MITSKKKITKYIKNIKVIPAAKIIGTGLARTGLIGAGIGNNQNSSHDSRDTDHGDTYQIEDINKFISTMGSDKSKKEKMDYIITAENG